MGGAVLLLAERGVAEVKRPLFSCVVPVKGERPYLDEALTSLRLQGMGDDLEIIVQDGDVEPDAGQSDALNKGFAKAHGEWLFWLNADDVLLPGALKTVQKRIVDRNGRANWIAGNVCYLDAEGIVTRCTSEWGWKRFYTGLPVRTFGPSSFFRRELLDVCGLLDTSLHFCMDTDLWGRFRGAGFWYMKMPDYVWGFRVHAESKTSGALKGAPPLRMQDEISVVDERNAVNHWKLRTALLRAVRVLDGSTIRSLFDTMRFRGKNWREVI